MLKLVLVCINKGWWLW